MCLRGGTEAAWDTHDRAPCVEPRWNPGTRKVVGATGFEPATPCAQGKLGELRSTDFRMICSVREAWDQIWDHPSRRRAVADGEDGKKRSIDASVSIVRRCRSVLRQSRSFKHLALLHPFRRGIRTTLPSPLGATGILTCWLAATRSSFSRCA